MLYNNLHRGLHISVQMFEYTKKKTYDERANVLERTNRRSEKLIKSLNFSDCGCKTETKSDDFNPYYLIYSFLAH